MKIGLAGGGTGGHFYPLIAVAEEIREVAQEQKLFEPHIYYFGPEPYNERALFENDVEFVKIGAGKMRRYFSIKKYTGCVPRYRWYIFRFTQTLFSIS